MFYFSAQGFSFSSRADWSENMYNVQRERWESGAVWRVMWVFCVCLSDYEVNCRPAHGFIHVLPITHNMTEFTRVIKEQRISGNMDTPEGGFDAMLQATVCQVNTPETYTAFRESAPHWWVIAAFLAGLGGCRGVAV